MRIPNLGETELLVPLHDGMFEKPMWNTFLNRLKLAAGCDDAGLLIRAADSASIIHLAAASDAAPAGLRNLFAAGSMREGRVYSLAELLESGGQTQQDPARTTLTSAGIANLRAVRLSGPGGLNAWLALSSSEAIPPSASALLSALVPHLRVALRVLARMEDERARASMTAGAFSHIDFGWIAVDRRCHVVDMDEQAERFLSRTGALQQGPYGRLTPSAPAIDRELTALVKEFAETPDARPCVSLPCQQAARRWRWSISAATRALPRTGVSNSSTCSS